MRKSHVIMMCGVAGSGKTTYALLREKEGYRRLSIDETLWKDYGKYCIDYPEDLYGEYSVIIENKLKNQLIEYLIKGDNVVIDFSFWNKSSREEYKNIILGYDGTVDLIYLKASEEVLRRRLKERSKRFDANAAFTITDEILDKFYNGFEEPNDEGEIVILQER